MLEKKFRNWFSSANKLSKPRVYQIDIKKLKKWNFAETTIHHTSNKFFNFKYYEIQSNDGKISETYYSPFIIQKEVGILGILAKKFKNEYKYLLQAKFEPGNINKIQISPTLQATKSNYTKVHKGKSANFVSFFLNAIIKKNYIFKKKLPEQGTRYINKFNQNIIIEIKNEYIKVPKNFLWVSKNEIKNLLKKNNLLNMDTLSVLSCVVKKESQSTSYCTNNEIKDKISAFNKSHNQKKKLLSLINLKGWEYKNKKIVNLKKEYFSIIGIRTITNSREIKSWDQPIIKEYHKGIVGFIVKKFNNSIHYYMQIVKEPGYVNPLLTASICIKDFSIKDYNKNFFIKILKKTNKSKVLFKKTLSEEGGRFFHKQNQNIIIEVKNNIYNIQKKNYSWISHNQMVDLIKKGTISIEARNLFVSFNMEKIL